MTHRRRIVVAIAALLACAPIFAAGRAACCGPVSSAPAPAAHACCRPGANTVASMPRGCCKAPVAPKPASRVRESAPIVLPSLVSPAGTTAVAAALVSPSSMLRLARMGHRAETPDESPPDRLSRNRVLLI